MFDDIDSPFADYLVKEGSLPNVTFPVSRNWAGTIPVNRAHHPNDTLFFWAFEHKSGSLTSKKTDEPWAIWLNGGYVIDDGTLMSHD